MDIIKSLQSLSDLLPDPENANAGTERGQYMLDRSIGDVGAGRSIVADKDGVVLAGNKTLQAAIDAGLKMRVVQTGGDELVVVQRTDLDVDGETRERAKRLAYLDNRTAEVGLEWDPAQLLRDIQEGVGVEDMFFDDELAELLEGLVEPEPPPDAEPQIDRAEELREKWQVEPGQLWRLGGHLLICGDCTDAAVVERVMGGEKARMIFTDPPYGIGKEIINDNLKRDDWLRFYQSFTSVMLEHVIENAYVYVWGYFETLSDYWQEVVKSRGDCNFRNFIVWRKTFIQGVNSLEFRQFPEHYEAALLFIFGQPFQIQNGPWSTSPNAEYFPEIFEPLRAYLDGEREKMGWDIPTVKKMVGHSDLSRDHWFSRSQWSMPTREVYETLQRSAQDDAFRREYDELRREYDAFRREYDELRGHFDNSHGYTDIWDFTGDSFTLCADHPTVKPVEVCERGIVTTSKEGELVLDVFLGSGSTLLACERLGRRCRAVEIAPEYVAVAIQRWVDATGGTPKLLERVDNHWT